MRYIKDLAIAEPVRINGRLGLPVSRDQTHTYFLTISRDGINKQRWVNELSSAIILGEWRIFERRSHKVLPLLFEGAWQWA